MPTESPVVKRMPLRARRAYRLSLVAALSLVFAYALQTPLPFIAPIFALVLTLKPAPPLGLKGLLALLVAVVVTLAVGLLLIPLLMHYALAAVLLVAVGLYLSFYLTINRGQVLIGIFLTMGITLISAAGTLDFAIATTVMKALLFGIVIAIVCQWLIYPWFPEDDLSGQKEAGAAAGQSNWIALRGTLIVLPAYLLVLTNPGAYLAIIMKSVSLAQQSSLVDARHAGRELLGSTFLAGVFAVLFWALLSILPNLWMFFLWMLLFSIYVSSKIFTLLESRFPPSFWLNVAITLLILTGPAVEDTASGKDVYKAFLIRLGLFVAVTLYA